MSRQLFDRLVRKTIRDLPKNVQAMLRETPVIIEDEPSADLLKELHIRCKPGKSDLCGLHWGTALGERSVFASGVDEGRVLLFRGPIRRSAGRSIKELELQIRLTLLHEIGHHFGMDEEELEELGYG